MSRTRQGEPGEPDPFEEGRAIVLDVPKQVPALAARLAQAATHNHGWVRLFTRTVLRRLVQSSRWIVPGTILKGAVERFLIAKEADNEDLHMISTMCADQAHWVRDFVAHGGDREHWLKIIVQLRLVCAVVEAHNGEDAAVFTIAPVAVVALADTKEDRIRITEDLEKLAGRLAEAEGKPTPKTETNLKIVTGEDKEENDGEA